MARRADRAVEPARRVCTSFDVWLVGFGLSRAVAKLELLPDVWAFQVLMIAAGSSIPDRPFVRRRGAWIEHRSVYQCTPPPDATPANMLVSIVKVEPNGTRTLEFDFDSDIKHIDSENGFEKGG
jgi:hypothetical protein